MHVWICVPTINREALLPDCLASIANLTVPERVRVFVLLVDNSKTQAARAVFDTHATNFPHPFFYIHEPHRGIATARNACIHYILNAEHEKDNANILFVDDDMRLPADYLVQSIRAMHTHRADAVQGRMHLLAADGSTHPPRHKNLFAKQEMLGTNGALIAARLFTKLGLRFDEQYIHGAEDSDFFYRAYLLGARLFLCEDYHFYEYRPPHRMRALPRKEELAITHATLRRRVAIRRYRGGLARALLYVVRRSTAIVLQIFLSTLLFPLMPKKQIRRLQNCAYRLSGLASGLRGFQITFPDPTRDLDKP